MLLVDRCRCCWYLALVLQTFVVVADSAVFFVSQKTLSFLMSVAKTKPCFAAYNEVVPHKMRLYRAIYGCTAYNEVLPRMTWLYRMYRGCTSSSGESSHGSPQTPHVQPDKLPGHPPFSLGTYPTDPRRCRRQWCVADGWTDHGTESIIYGVESTGGTAIII